MLVNPVSGAVRPLFKLDESILLLGCSVYWYKEGLFKSLGIFSVSVVFRVKADWSVNSDTVELDRDLVDS